MVALSLGLLVALALIFRAVFDAPRPARAGTSPDRAAVQRVLDEAASLIRAGEAARARAALDAAIAREPAEGTLYLALAEASVAQQDYPGAYGAYEKAIALGITDPATQFAAGTVASLAGRLDRAIEHYSQAQLGDIVNPIYPLFLAQVQIKHGDIEDAKASLLRCIRLDADEARAWGTLAELFLAENKADLAIQHAREARRADPEVPRWRLVEAKGLKRQGKPGEALDLVLALPPDRRRDEASLKLIGECYGMLRQPEEAARLYGEASDAQPVVVGLAMEAAVWFDRAGDGAKAATYARRAFGLGAAEAGEMLKRLESRP